MPPPQWLQSVRLLPPVGCAPGECRLEVDIRHGGFEFEWPALLTLTLAPGARASCRPSEAADPCPPVARSSLEAAGFAQRALESQPPKSLPASVAACVVAVRANAASVWPPGDASTAVLAGASLSRVTAPPGGAPSWWPASLCARLALLAAAMSHERFRALCAPMPRLFGDRALARAAGSGGPGAVAGARAAPLLSAAEGGLVGADDGGPDGRVDWVRARAALLEASGWAGRWAAEGGVPASAPGMDALRLLAWLADPHLPAMEPVDVDGPRLEEEGALPDGCAPRPAMAFRVRGPAELLWGARHGATAPAAGRRWHGTGAECLHSVVCGGLRVLSGSRHMRTGAAHGDGVYVAHRPELALSYASDPSGAGGARPSACVVPACLPLARRVGFGPALPGGTRPVSCRCVLAVRVAAADDRGRVVELSSPGPGGEPSAATLVRDPSLLLVTHLLVFAGAGGRADAGAGGRADAGATREAARARPAAPAPIVSGGCVLATLAVAAAVTAAQLLAAR